MRGVVACEALYPLIDRFAPHFPVRYLPAELHEFPVNVPVETAITEHVQTAIDDLDGPGLDAIVLSYASAENLTGVSTRHAPLIVSLSADCTSSLLPGAVNEYGENKAAGTLYLTRGWIDCGVDSYKLYTAYRSETDQLIERFDEAANRHPSLRVSWHLGDRFQRAAGRDTPASPDAVDQFFHSVVQYYDRVVLVDSGDLYEVHHEYAETVHGFIGRLRREYGTEHDVELDLIDGRTDRIERLLTGDLAGRAIGARYRPGTSVGSQ